MPESTIGARTISPSLQGILTELRGRLEKLYGDRLVRLMLFGSQARGDARSWSDIDVLVVLKGPVNPHREIMRTEEILSDLSLDHNVVLSGLYMEEERFLHSSDPLMVNLRRESIEV